MSALVGLGMTLATSVGALSFSPAPPDLNDLDHATAWKWGVNWSVPTGYHIDSAALVFNNLRDTDAGELDDILWVNLLNFVRTDSPFAGDPWPFQKSYTDSGADGNYWNGRGTALGKWVEGVDYTGNQIKTWTINFNDAALNALKDYSSDSYFGFGIDPDCHFENCGIVLTINYSSDVPPTPEAGSTLILLGLGLLGTLGFQFRSRK